MTIRYLSQEAANYNLVDAARCYATGTPYEVPVRSDLKDNDTAAHVEHDGGDSDTLRYTLGKNAMADIDTRS